MDNLASGVLSRTRMYIAGGNSIDRLSDWLCQNTKHPRNVEEKWDFSGHEYQIEILNDTTPHLSGRKCSQVGFSEMTVRQACGWAAIRQGIHMIYTLPTAAFASTFTKSRVDPMIEASPTLRDMLSSDVDSAMVKRIGNSFIYFRGTVGQGSAISIPASVLIHDEVDFSDLDNLTTYSSRLGHEAEEDLLKRLFSTPTTSGRAIDASFKLGSQKYYAVRHDRCGKVVVPELFRDSVIPGYDGDLKLLRKEDLGNPKFGWKEAHLKCPGCGSPISQENLINPAKRLWVAAYPDRDKASYQVSPFDVAKINPPARTWQQMADYKRYSDWVNFKVGLTSDDAENSVLREVLEDNNQFGNFHANNWIQPVEWDVEDDDRESILYGAYAGLDIGKTSWFKVGVREPYDWANPSKRRKMKIVYAEAIQQDGDDFLGKRVGQLLDIFGVAKMVVDAAPDFTTAMGLVNRFPGRVFACRYIDNVRRTKDGLVNAELDEVSGVVTAFRTGSLDDAVKAINTGMVVYPLMPEDLREVITEHLTAIKKTPRVSAKGSNENGGDENEKMFWETVGKKGDHFMHALNYLLIAEGLDERGSNGHDYGYAMAAKARLKDGEEEANQIRRPY